MVRRAVHHLRKQHLQWAVLWAQGLVSQHKVRVVQHQWLELHQPQAALARLNRHLNGRTQHRLNPLLPWVALSAQALDSPLLPSLDQARLEAQGLQWLQHQALAPPSRQLNLHRAKAVEWL